MPERVSPRAIRALAWAVATGVALWVGSVALSALVVGGAAVFPSWERATSDPAPRWILLAQVIGFTGFAFAFAAFAVLAAWFLRRAIVARAPEVPR